MPEKTRIEELVNLSESPDKILANLLPILVNLLHCDRCFLYLRDPETKLGKTAFCWCRSQEIPDVTHLQIEKEPVSLPAEDPLFAAALRTEPSIFVEDVETASRDQVNRDFEAKNFGHRALIHAHLCENNQLWGILQPCVFGQPRHWSDFDRELIDQVVKLITPVAITYVKSEIRGSL
ncbi:GAF domain-containing protein [Gloeothece verrucosa]|uniref:Putative GAF sensor protein n=1 Tax=Gloeothece verrucosa (strain PCC 7822) TaxID=497965 RepID=E0UK13_GLOV7|nr:GAF domain-containing protein [Gloeothece verrucosa]ADN14649.1 putative GAF sensor protein [Gloeothece verrucosa PCC 7822]